MTLMSRSCYAKVNRLHLYCVTQVYVLFFACYIQSVDHMYQQPYLLLGG